MKYYILPFLTCVLFSCKERKVKFVPENFEIEHIEVKLSNGMHDIIRYKDGYIFRTEDFKDSGFVIGYLDRDFKIDKKLSQLLGGKKSWYSAIWTSGDTLFAVKGGRPNYATFFWDQDHWKLINIFHITKESFGSSELNYPIYEDYAYSIHSCCRGEFGGAIFFYEKKTGKTFSCRATCLVGIQKLNQSFYVTTSLPHFSGFSRIIQIKNPAKLYEIKQKSQLNDCNWYDIYTENTSDRTTHPEGYDKGYEVLLDTMNVHIVGAFSHKKHIYHIYSDNKNTYVGYLGNKKLIPVDTIMNKVAWHGKVRDLKHNPTIFPVRSQDLNGVIVVNGKKIKLVEFK